MPIARVRLGLPLGGMNREERGLLPIPQATDRWFASDIQGWRFQTSRSMIPLPGVSTLANTYNANRITRMFNIRWGNGTSDTVRHDKASFTELLNGVWTARDPAAGYGASTNDDYWGSALVPSTDGAGLYMFSNRIVGPFTWDGVAANASNAPANSNPARHVIAFADRAFLFNILGSGISFRSCQWSVRGDGSVFTGTGSGDHDFTQFDGEITGVSTLRGSLFVYHRFGLVAGTETFNVDSPVHYEPITTNGLGLWAPNSLLTYNDVNAFLSEDGFRAWDGQQILEIGRPIDQYILSRINRNAINTVCGFVKPDWHIAAWALPMDSSSTNNEMWMFDFKHQVWHRLPLSPYFTSPVTAFTVSTAQSSPAWSDAIFLVPWSDPSMATKRWQDFGGVSSLPTVITGHEDGVTRTMDEGGYATNIALIIETQDFTWEGTVMTEADGFRDAGHIGPNDITCLDEIDLLYRTLSGATSLYISVSTDGGQTFTPFGSGVNGRVTLSAGSGDQVKRVRVFGRKSGQFLRVKITSIDPATGASSGPQIKLEDIIFSARKMGEVRSTS